MGKPVLGVVGSDRLQGLGDGLEEDVVWVGLGGAEERLHLAPHHLDGVEVWRVGGKETGLCACGRDERQCGLALVGPQVVQHDDVAGAQGGHEHFANVGLVHLGVGSPGAGYACARAVEPDRGDHGGGCQVSMRTTRH